MSSTSKIEINDETITRFLTGDAGPEEAVAIADWLKVFENRAYFERFEETWRLAAKVARPEFGKADAWKRLSVDVHIPAASKHVVNKSSLWPLSIAAALILLAVAAYFVFNTSPPLPPPPMGSATTTDSFRFIELSDRSTVTLHRNTELQYPAQFTGEIRRVRLQRGEAFFNATSEADRPFIVEAGGLTIKVYGTEFNLRHQDSVTSVHVREGRVLVTSPVDSITLTTGLTGHVRGGHISVTDAPVGNLYSYATQRLVFQDASLAEVVHDLQNSYPYTFELKTRSLENCRITANFYKDDIDKIVNLIAETLNLTVAKNGRHFTLEGEGCL